MNLDVYNELAKGFAITHATIANPRKIAFAMQEVVEVEGNDYAPASDELRARIVTYAPDLLESRGGYGFVKWEHGIRQFYVSVLDRLIVGANDFDVWESKTDGQLHSVSTANAKAVWGSCIIDGKAYLTGSMRKVFKRKGVLDWCDITASSEHPNLHQDIKLTQSNMGGVIDMEIGFHAIDGFNSKDIYAGGARGDMWRYDGLLWHKITLPIGIQIKSICCAGDGYVYIAGAENQLVRGRHETWSVIEAGDIGHFNSMAWFKGKLYLANDYGLYTLNDLTVEHYCFDERFSKQNSFKNVTASESALLSYSHYQALVFDGNSWEEIIGAYMSA